MEAIITPEKPIKVSVTKLDMHPKFYGINGAIGGAGFLGLAGSGLFVLLHLQLLESRHAILFVMIGLVVFILSSVMLVILSGIIDKPVEIDESLFSSPEWQSKIATAVFNCMGTARPIKGELKKEILTTVRESKKQKLTSTKYLQPEEVF